MDATPSVHEDAPPLLSAHDPSFAEVADILTAAFELDELAPLSKQVADAVGGAGPSDGGAAISAQGSAVVQGAIDIVLAHGWGFGDTGDPEAPTLADEALREQRLTQADMAVLRQLVFPRAPSSMLDPGRVSEVRDSAARGAPAASCETRIAVVTVGTPGAGKSFVTKGMALPHLRETARGPTAYVDVDPDLFLTELCDNDNGMRALANFCNHESFVYAIGQRRPLVFHGTGKSLETTCSRVIARLREAGYRVVISVVLASRATCERRIAERRLQTGRDVPGFILDSAFGALRQALPVYLAKRGQLAEAILVYDNDQDQPTPVPTMTLTADTDPTPALELVERMLGGEPS